MNTSLQLTKVSRRLQYWIPFNVSVCYRYCTSNNGSYELVFRSIIVLSSRLRRLTKGLSSTFFLALKFGAYFDCVDYSAFFTSAIIKFMSKTTLSTMKK